MSSELPAILCSGSSSSAKTESLKSHIVFSSSDTSGKSNRELERVAPVRSLAPPHAAEHAREEATEEAAGSTRANQPALPQQTLELHNAGGCSPCFQVLAATGRCRRGDSCAYCHFDHDAPTKARPSKPNRDKVKRYVLELEEKIHADPENFVEHLRGILTHALAMGSRKCDFLFAVVKNKLRAMESDTSGKLDQSIVGLALKVFDTMVGEKDSKSTNNDVGPEDLHPRTGCSQSSAHKQPQHETDDDAKASERPKHLSL
eukprot:TRINITY_DN64541_c0_g1_i1.p1 TRINITY_DN64541_c0_g1~~TRINITY_DN64541_c0_g1_i1.p1  ORF type:complete len:260 (-),score=31.17 TRINITY_DN64541_c0_g1_i1:416-1195(-)